ncbi:MAG: hypothetical protein ACXAD7_09080 [Candidatus Kariarchaeaceae archaeon]|jgi:ssDNA-binding replication factor A large subunit
MKIKDLVEDETFDALKARILSKQGPKRVKTKGGISYVTDVLLADDTGTVVFNLWGIQKAEQFRVGEVVEIRNGWCKIYNYQKQLSLGKIGRIIKVADDPSLPRTIPY